jgi:hypothetical protein
VEISKKFFPEIMLENEQNYISQLEGVVSSIDEYAGMEITKTPTAYIFRIVPSIPRYNQMLLQEILQFNNLFGIRLDLSKSIKSSTTIAFKINLNN